MSVVCGELEQQQQHVLWPKAMILAGSLSRLLIYNMTQLIRVDTVIRNEFRFDTFRIR